ncbi:MAG: DUF421 domain-containing protein [Candidatus Onthomonas sp.]
MSFLILCLTTLSSFGVLFLIAKIVGHKQISQLDFFDYITGITIGSIAAEMATELEQPWKPLVAMILYGGVALLLSILTNKLPESRKYLNGTPTILMDHGKLYRENLKKAKLDLSEFMVMCRQQGYFDLTSIETAIFEYNGKLTILPVSGRRPATPHDLNLAPAQELLFTELIMDGRVLEENLQRMGLDRTWLDKQLKQRHVHSPREVFLALCDRNLTFVLYENSRINAPKHSTEKS